MELHRFCRACAVLLILVSGADRPAARTTAASCERLAVRSLPAATIASAQAGDHGIVHAA